MSYSPFGNDFQSARTKFRDAATAAGATLSEYAHPQAGPDGKALATDTAWLGSKSASKVLVTVSGTHGVEGFCGSGAQVDWLERKETLPEDTAALLVHAINPYGFAWCRRVTHENVDLNRNWVDFDEPLPMNPGYDKIAAPLCPRDWTDGTRQRAMSELLAYVQAHGKKDFVKAVSGGQYRHPKGLFYGGSGPTASRLTLSTIFANHLARAQRIGFIDYHSGLGPTGFGEQIVTEPQGSPAFARAQRWFGAAVKSVAAGDSASAKIEGGWIGAAPDLLSHAEVTSIALEFGTVDDMVVLEALRADSWLHAYGDPTSPQAQAIQSFTRNAFYIDHDLWRGMVLGQSLIACRQAIAGLQ